MLPRNSESKYIDPREFDKKEIFAVAVVVISPNGDEVLLKTSKKYGKPAIISGRGPLNENPKDPDGAATVEIEHSIGVSGAEAERMFVDEAKKIGVYKIIMDKEKALHSGGTSEELRWEPTQKAVDTEMIFEQEVYIARVTGMQKSKK